jgi:mono/diheme cytochrome c family protein
LIGLTRRIDLARLEWFVALLVALGVSASKIASAGDEIAARAKSVLADHCFECHGPDSNSRQADLNLADDLRGLNAKNVAADDEANPLLERITRDDAQRMPPPDRDRLAPREIETLRQWLDQGAPPPQHWSYRPIAQPAVAPMDRWSANGIDSFVRRRKDVNGLVSSPRADRRTLVRRLAFDLTGLPPTPRQITDFVADSAPDAYDRLVDRLLASPQYGEQMAVAWLDGARFADTNGHQHDNARDMSAWREWVINAYNANQPFDQFTTEQIAGDLLPDATVDQRIATGFFRNHELNFEGGSIAEESRVGYVMDRVETMATVWMGLTLHCARCHDHKYDPLTQRDYYRLFAFFNSVDEQGYAGEDGNAAPLLHTPTANYRERVAAAEQAVRRAESQLQKLVTHRDREQVRWERRIESRAVAPPELTTVRPAWQFLPNNGDNSGRSSRGHQFERRHYLELGNVGDFERDQPFSIAAWVRPADETFAPIVARVHFHGYDLCWGNGHFYAHLVNRWDNNGLFVRSTERFRSGEWLHVAATYDGSSSATGLKLFVNGDEVELDVEMDSLTGSIRSASSLFAATRNAATAERFRGEIADVRLYQQALQPWQVSAVAEANTFARIMATPAHRRTLRDQLWLRRCFLDNESPEFAALREGRATAAKQLNLLRDAMPTTMVLEQRDSPRTTHVLTRGQYDKPGEQVETGTPEFLPPAAASDEMLDRLDLAEWLLRDDHPLVARVAVNREWQRLFGAGLVSTSGDFGTRGSAPSHPSCWIGSRPSSYRAAGTASDCTA